MKSNYKNKFENLKTKYLSQQLTRLRSVPKYTLNGACASYDYWWQLPSYLPLPDWTALLQLARRKPQRRLQRRQPTAPTKKTQPFHTLTGSAGQTLCLRVLRVSTSPSKSNSYVTFLSKQTQIFLLKPLVSLLL